MRPAEPRAVAPIELDLGVAGPHRLEFGRHAEVAELPVDNRLSLRDRPV